MDNNYNEIMRKLDYLYHWNDCCEYPTLFKFELGIEIVNKLIAHDKTHSFMYKGEKITVFGINVDINFHNPYCIKLWKECFY